MKLVELNSLLVFEKIKFYSLALYYNNDLIGGYSIWDEGELSNGSVQALKLQGHMIHKNRYAYMTSTATCLSDITLNYNLTLIIKNINNIEQAFEAIDKYNTKYRLLI